MGPGWKRRQISPAAPLQPLGGGRAGSSVPPRKTSRSPHQSISQASSAGPGPSCPAFPGGALNACARPPPPPPPPSPPAPSGKGSLQTPAPTPTQGPLSAPLPPQGYARPRRGEAGRGGPGPGGREGDRPHPTPPPALRPAAPPPSPPHHTKASGVSGSFPPPAPGEKAAPPPTPPDPPPPAPPPLTRPGRPGLDRKRGSQAVGGTLRLASPRPLPAPPAPPPPLPLARRQAARGGAELGRQAAAALETAPPPPPRPRSLVVPATSPARRPRKRLVERRALPLPASVAERVFGPARRGGRREGRREGGRRSRHHDGGQEQQDAAAHRLPHAVHPARRARLHRHLQGLRQAHEPHPLRLRRVPQDQAQELQAAGAGGEAGPGPGAAARREPGLHDGGGAAPQRHWHCPRAPGRCGRGTWCRQSSWERSASGGSHAPGPGGFGWPCPWSGRTVPTGDDPSESRDGSRGSSRSHRQHCRSPHAVRAWPWRPTPSHGQGDSSSRNDGTSSWHEASHGPPHGHAPWPRLTDGHAPSWDEAASPGHERPSATRHAPTPALRQAATRAGSAPAGVVCWGKGGGGEIICVHVFYALVAINFLIKVGKFPAVWQQFTLQGGPAGLRSFGRREAGAAVSPAPKHPLTSSLNCFPVASWLDLRASCSISFVSRSPGEGGDPCLRAHFCSLAWLEDCSQVQLFSTKKPVNSYPVTQAG